MKDEPNIGQLCAEGARRDAIHVAVAPVVAGHALDSGDGVFLEEGKAYWCGMVDSRCIGVVDPFLRKRVEADQKFWLFLKPGTIESLRHVWSHPAFTAKLPKQEKSDE